MTKLIFVQKLPDAFPRTENTQLVLEVDDPVDIHELLGYFVRFAMAAGYHPESIQNAVIALAHDYEKETLERKYDKQD